MPTPLLTYQEAAEQVQRFIQTRANSTKKLSRPPELVPLDAAPGRVLAQEIRADRDQPPFPRSTRDGFACRAAEASANQFLYLAGQIRAGEAPTKAIAPGELWEIMTGAPVPAGADAVFMVEYAERSPEPASNLVRLAAPRTLQPGENIVPQAAEARAGDMLIPPGIRIGAPHIAMAAQCGYARLAVVPRPRVVILSTGDELVPIASIPGPSQIRNSNSPMLAALVTAAGAEPIVLPTAPDQESATDVAVAQALSSKIDADLFLITGGISAGRFDLVEGALTRARARFFFRGVAIQPGKPIAFGQLPRHGREPLPFFALPGNPISSAATFQLFATPLLAALSNDVSPQPRFALAQLAGNWKGKPGLTRFLPANCDFLLNQSASAPQVRLIPWQGSGDIAAFARSNCYAVIPNQVTTLEDGSPIQILLP
ncbi:molybdopterin molybdotransferase MoeA [Acidicapsa ligni]|uniref:molybdopterin molybdotransferase MoeA n=1 Tax=Acidicapsa ligni TaxID=542300 RepID=UPI0021DF54CD|nr:gephyrin-like molybdotransferase Glp [Acidicapsa ligni]